MLSAIKRYTMKFSYFKFLAVASALTFAWSCTDESTTSSEAMPVQQERDYSNIQVRVDSYAFQEGDKLYLIASDNFIAYDSLGRALGAFDVNTNALLDLAGNAIVIGLDLSTLPVVPATIVPASSSEAVPLTPSSETVLPPQSSSELVAISSEALSSSVPPSSSSKAKSSSSIKSSSSKAKSSSSVKSSSSKAKSSSSIKETTEIKYIQGGKQGWGWASRYWDCCKPSCAWDANAGKKGPALTCDADTKEPLAVSSIQSVCDGGYAMTCTSQAPWAVNDTLAYGFAAVPAFDGNNCGKCFALKFNGEGNNGGDQSGVRGKTLIVIASNIGGDVGGGQFDVMIPGGGVGMFNGCSKMGWGNMGQQYGGLLADCGTENDINSRKSCLTQKCNSTFSNDTEAKNGCLFLANWMGGANNPKLEYKEVECPAALEAKYYY